MKPKKLKHPETGHILVKTQYGSYVDPKEDGMTQQKNTMSFNEAVNLGYKLYDDSQARQFLSNMDRDAIREFNPKFDW